MSRFLLIALVSVCCVGCGSTAIVVSSVHHRPCPAVDHGNAPSADPDTRIVLVPGEPYAVLVCRYWGFEGRTRTERQLDRDRAETLAGERYVTKTAKIASFVQRLDALKPPRREREPPHRIICGDDRAFGSERSVLLLFRYTNAPDDPVRITITNCIPVTNGHLRAFRFGGSLELGEHWPDEGVL